MSKAVQLFLSRILTSAPDFIRSLATALYLKQEVTKFSKCRPYTPLYIIQSRQLILTVSLFTFRDVINIYTMNFFLRFCILWELPYINVLEVAVCKKKPAYNWYT